MGFGHPACRALRRVRGGRKNRRSRRWPSFGRRPCGCNVGQSLRTPKHVQSTFRRGTVVSSRRRPVAWPSACVTRGHGLDWAHGVHVVYPLMVRQRQRHRHPMAAAGAGGGAWRGMLHRACPAPPRCTPRARSGRFTVATTSSRVRGSGTTRAGRPGARPRTADSWWPRSSGAQAPRSGPQARERCTWPRAGHGRVSAGEPLLPGLANSRWRGLLHRQVETDNRWVPGTAADHQRRGPRARNWRPRGRRRGVAGSSRCLLLEVPEGGRFHDRRRRRYATSQAPSATVWGLVAHALRLVAGVRLAAAARAARCGGDDGRYRTAGGARGTAQDSWRFGCS